MRKKKKVIVKQTNPTWDLSDFYENYVWNIKTEDEFVEVVKEMFNHAPMLDEEYIIKKLKNYYIVK